MLLRIIGFLLVAVLLSIFLSLWLGISVVTMFLKLVVLVKSIKWVVIYTAVRSYLIKEAPKRLLSRQLTALIIRFLKGFGLWHITTWLIQKAKSLWRRTIGRLNSWIQTKGFGTRLVWSLFVTGSLIWVSIWAGFIWVMFVLIPAEIAIFFNLVVSTIGRTLANTAFMKSFDKLINLLQLTRLGQWYSRANEAFEKHLGQGSESLGQTQRIKIAQTKSGRKFLKLIDRFAPDLKPPRHKPSRNPFAKGSIRAFDRSLSQKHKPRRK